MNIANGEYIPKKGLTFVFRNDGSLRNYFWENNWLAFVNEALCAALYSYILYMKITEKTREE